MSEMRLRGASSPKKLENENLERTRVDCLPVHLSKMWEKIPEGGKIAMNAESEFCVNCPQFKPSGNLGYCEKYNVEIALDLAGKARLCEDWEFPKTRKRKSKQVNGYGW